MINLPERDGSRYHDTILKVISRNDLLDLYVTCISKSFFLAGLYHRHRVIKLSGIRVAEIFGDVIILPFYFISPSIKLWISLHYLPELLKTWHFDLSRTSTQNRVLIFSNIHDLLKTIDSTIYFFSIVSDFPASAIFRSYKNSSLAFHLWGYFSLLLHLTSVMAYRPLMELERSIINDKSDNFNHQFLILFLSSV